MNFFKVSKYIFSDLEGYKALIVSYVIVNSLSAGFGMYLPVITGEFFQNLLDNNESAAISSLILFAIVLIPVRTVAPFFNFIYSIKAPFFHHRKFKKNFSHMIHHSQKFFADNPVGDLTSRSKRCSHGVISTRNQFFTYFFEILSSLIIAFILFNQKAGLIAFAILGFCVIYCAIVIFLLYKKKDLNVREEEANHVFHTHLSDSIQNHFNLQLFATIKDEEEIFVKNNEAWYDLFIQKFHINTYMLLSQVLVIILFDLGVIYYSAGLVMQGVLSVGDIIAIQGLMMFFFMRVWHLPFFVYMVLQSYSEIWQFLKITGVDHELKDNSTNDLNINSGLLEFKDVTLSDDKKDLIKDISFSIKKGERVGLVGTSGAGKTTLINALLRFFDVSSGKIMIDGQDISQYTQKSLRDNISVIPQEPSLFHRSIAENIGYPRPGISLDEIKKAAKKAHIHDFIMQTEDGYDTMVGERGIKLSGGQRQRVAIARAFIKDAPFLVLDEATSALDSESEKYIHDSLEDLMEGRTVIIIAHRFSSLKSVDRILAMDKGSLVEDASPDELLTKEDGIYRKLWKLQKESL